MHALTRFIIACGLAGLAACGPAGGAPVIDDPGPQMAAVNVPFTLNIFASDPDGEDLAYDFTTSVEGLRSRAQLTEDRGGGGIFRFTPQASDIGEVYVDIIVSDGSNTVTLTVRIDVRAALGDAATPTITNPDGQGTALNLARESCVEFEVTVADSDDTQVDLSLGEPLIVGATLTPTSGLAANFRWCPTADQAEQRSFTARFVADDGENAPAVKNYTIVVSGAPATDPDPDPDPDPGPTCNEDAFEPNLAWEDATPTNTFTDLTWNSEDVTPFLSFCDSSDLDTFQVKVFDGDNISIAVNTDSPGHQIEGNMYSGPDVLAWEAGATSTVNGAILVYSVNDASCPWDDVNPVPCTYFFEFFNASDTPVTDYRLSYEISLETTDT